MKEIKKELRLRGKKKERGEEEEIKTDPSFFSLAIVGDGGVEGDIWQGPSHSLNSSAPITSTCP